MLLFEDLALVPIIFGLSALGPGQHGIEDMLRTLLIGGLTVGLLLVGGRLLLPRLFAQAARTKSPELFLAASLLVVILASIATTAAGLSPIVGALVAGILIAETDYHDEVEAITAPFKGLALGVFLITVGISLDPRIIVAQWSQLLAATVGVVAAKTAVTYLLLRLGRTSAGVSFETSLLMSAPSETTLIVLGTAASAGLLSAQAAGFWQIVTAIGLTITPLLSAAGHLIGRRIEHAVATTETDPGEHGAIVIVGLGRVGRLIAQMLREHDLSYVAIDSDPDVIASARERGYAVQFGDFARPGMIEQLGVEHAPAVILTMDDRVQAVRMTARLRIRFPDLTIIVRARDPNHAAQLYRAGATDAVPETVEASLQLSEAALVDLGLAMGPVIASIHEKRGQLRAKIMKMAGLEREPPLRRRTLDEIEAVG